MGKWIIEFKNEERKEIPDGKTIEDMLNEHDPNHNWWKIYQHGRYLNNPEDEDSGTESEWWIYHYSKGDMGYVEDFYVVHYYH